MATAVPILLTEPEMSPIAREFLDAANDEAGIAKWAAFFDRLPADERASFDESGRAIAERMRRR